MKFLLKFKFLICRECPTEIETDPRIIDTIEGETFHVRCWEKHDKNTRYRKWVQCKWERMDDGSYCTFDYKKVVIDGENRYEVIDKCVGLDDHYFFGDEGLYKGEDNPYCGLNINPTSLKDRGNWRCSLVFEEPEDAILCIAETLVLAEVIF